MKQSIKDFLIILLIVSAAIFLTRCNNPVPYNHTPSDTSKVLIRAGDRWQSQAMIEAIRISKDSLAPNSTDSTRNTWQRVNVYFTLQPVRDTTRKDSVRYEWLPFTGKVKDYDLLLDKK